MTENSVAFVGDIPHHYDRGLGPVIFVDYAAEMARRAAALKPSRVLETAAGTGIVTRALRDHLPAETRLTATDLTAPMLTVAQTKFRAEERVDFQTADALALPFEDAAFDAVVCQFGVMFYPDKDLGYREAKRVLAPDGTYLFSVWDTHRYNTFARLVHEALGRAFQKCARPVVVFRGRQGPTQFELQSGVLGGGREGYAAGRYSAGGVHPLERHPRDFRRAGLVDRSRGEEVASPDEVFRVGALGPREECQDRENGTLPHAQPRKTHSAPARVKRISPGPEQFGPPYSAQIELSCGSSMT